MTWVDLRLQRLQLTDNKYKSKRSNHKHVFCLLLKRINYEVHKEFVYREKFSPDDILREHLSPLKLIDQSIALKENTPEDHPSISERRRQKSFFSILLS